MDMGFQRSQCHIGFVHGWDVHTRRTLGLYGSKQERYFFAHLSHGRIVSLFLFSAWCLLRNAGHHHGNSPYTDSYAYTDSHTDAYCYSYTEP